jgi:small subunit ribosomal protein S11
MMGFKGSRKATPFAGQLTGEDAARKAMEIAGMVEVDVEVTGPGSGRESALRALQAAGLVVKTIKDTTPSAHNGVKAKKRRRV